MLGAETLDHIAIPVRDLEQAEKFYLDAVGLKLLTRRKNADGSPRHTQTLGLKPAGEERGETLLKFANHQIIGLKPVTALSDRTKRHGRAVHVAFNVNQEDFDQMVALVPEMEGRSYGDFRAGDGLRPPGERSLYLFDPDTNPLQITAHGEEDWSLIPDEEKWRRTTENRQKQGKGISRFDAGVKAAKE